MYTIYTAPLCGYCSAAKNLLNTYNLEYLAIDLDTTEKKEDFKRKTGLKTVPQIYNDANEHIGGYDQLVEYLNRGKTP
tara:strand:- start:58 stop:291 length:234 start_codon:yes stop_codon:yes gene_type:complete